MNIKRELLEYLVRSCIREVIGQVKEADESKSDFYTDKDGSWCKWCGSKATDDMGGIKKCKNTTCKMNRHKKNPSPVKEAGDETKGAPAPPADGTGAGENLGIPKEKDTTPEPPSEPETPPSEIEIPKGICFINPRDTSTIIELFKEPEIEPPSVPKKKPGRKPKNATPSTPVAASVPSTAPPPAQPPIVEAVSPVAAYSHIPPKQLNRDQIERVIYYTAARFAGPKVKVALTTIRSVEDAIKTDKTIFLYIGKFDETSDEIYVIADANRQLARDGSLPSSELSGTAAPAPFGSDEFDPNTAGAEDMAQYMDKDAPGKVKIYGAPEDPEDLGDVGERKLTEFKKIVKRLVSEVLDR